MIETDAIKTLLIDQAVSGKMSTELVFDDSIAEIKKSLPELSKKRTKLLEQKYEYGSKPDIPEYWEWIRLGEITSYGDTPLKVSDSDVNEDSWILDLEDIKAGGELLAKTRVKDKEFIGEKIVFNKGQILYSKLRPYLKKVLVADEDGISTPELVSFDVFGGIIPQYIVYCLLSSFTNRAIDKRSYGVKMPRIDAGFMANLPIPLPPISEQKHIVDKLENAFDLIGKIENLQSAYISNRDALKRKLIDAGIRGKLTRQLPEDGTAEELYGQIQEEKKRLIEEGKIKKTKPLPEITEDEIPFEIPENWKWVRLEEISYRIWAGGDKPNDFTKEKDNKRTIPVVANGVTDDGVLGYTSSATAAKNTITVAGRGTIGFTVLRQYDYCPVVRLIVVEQSQLVEPRFLKLFLQSMPETSVGSSIPQLTVPMMKPKLVPLPPLSEQKRIAVRIDELLTHLPK